MTRISGQTLKPFLISLPCLQREMILIRVHLFSTFAKFFEKLTFLTPRYAHLRVRIKGYEIILFRKICVRTKWMISNQTRQKSSHIYRLKLLWILSRCYHSHEWHTSLLAKASGNINLTRNQNLNNEFTEIEDGIISTCDV